MAENRCALVTGASRGIGRSIAIRLAQDGWDIAGCFQTVSDASQETELAVQRCGVRSFFAPCNIADGQSVEEFVRTADRQIGPIVGLVNNAGITRDNPLALMSNEDWKVVVDTNLTGTWNVCKSVLFRFMKRRSGSVVNISSVAGIDGNRAQANYAATKAGIIGLSKSLAKELAPYAIRVNVVAPGFIETDMTKKLADTLRNHTLSTIPLKRFGTPSDVADLVAYLLSDRAAYITGETIRVDGGLTL